MKRIHRIVALLVITALMVVVVTIAGAPSAFGDAKATAEEGKPKAKAGKAEAAAGG